MAIPIKTNNMYDFANMELNGGKGSGNFGHKGRPGEVGGSGDGGAGSVRYLKKKDKVAGLDKEERYELDKAEKESPTGDGDPRESRAYSKQFERIRKIKSVKEGDRLKITPQDNLPNFDREIKVDYITDEGFHYGSSETSDGKVYPYWAIKDLKKLNIRKARNRMGLPGKYNIDKKLNSMAGLSAYENGGKGSGNFGHAGRPGLVGGSGDGTGIYVAKDVAEYGGHQGGNDWYEFGVEGYTQSTTEMEKLFPEGSTFYADGKEFTVQRGANGLEGVSEDGGITTAIPGDILDKTAQYMASDGEANNAGKRLGAWGEVVHKMYELGMPRLVGEEVMRYAEAEHRFASTKENRKKNLKRMQSYADSSRGALYAYATGNGMVDKRGISLTAKKGAKALSDQIKYGRQCAEDIAREHNGMKKSDYDLIMKKINEIEKLINGGKGSGNFGHYGRPGEVGGSASSPSAGVGIDTGLVAKGTMLRDYIDMEGEYMSDEHHKLCDIADSLYNADIGPEQFKEEYKELYEKYGKEYFDKVLEEMGDIDYNTRTTADEAKLLEQYQQDKSNDGVKGGTKAEHEAYIKLITDYYDGDERGFKGALEDARAGGLPGESNYQKALKSVEAGNFGISYDDCYRDLKSIYGKQFKESTYLTKSGEYKYKDGEPYVWTIYKAKIAKALADEMDKEDRQ